jgi:hypothetical protein
MPIPGRDRENPRADGRLLEFIAERRLAQARQRRQMIVLGATAGAALILLSVTVVSLLFVRPQKSTPVASPTPTPASQATPPRVADVPRAPVPSAATRTVEPDRPVSPAPDPATPAPGPVTTAPDPGTAQPEPVPSTSTPAPPTSAAAPRTSAAAPRTSAAAPPTSAAAPPTSPPASPTPGPLTAPTGPRSVPPAGDAWASADPARRTASWLVQNYGRLEAENRATMVAEFYSGERRAFWQRVLSEVRSIPER